MGSKHWHSLEAAVTDNVWNYWSANDSMLRWCYKLAGIGEVAAGHTGFQSKHARIKDRNVIRIVSGHSAYVSQVTLQA